MMQPSADFRRKLLLWLGACGGGGLCGFKREMRRVCFYNNPYDPVRPPMPPDDPESHELMHCVYGKKGWSKWHENGELSGLENPTWQQCLDQYVTRSPR